MPWFSDYERHSSTFREARIGAIHAELPGRAIIERIGGWFRTEVPVHTEAAPRVLSPYHGRSAVVLEPDGSFIAIKGVGFTWAKPLIYRSLKDSELTFGLLAEKDALREIEVSAMANTLTGDFAEVIGAALLTAIEIRGETVMLDELHWTNGELLRPCLLYTRQRSPLRVMDLLFMNDASLERGIAAACEARSWHRGEYLVRFAEAVGRTIACLHLAGGVNDTLEAGNITLAAEVTDFEWLHLPPVESPFTGDDGGRLAERQEKELLYGIEAITFLAARLGRSGIEEQRILLETYLSEGGTAQDAVERLSSTHYL